MKQKISMLMDGELNNEDAEALLGKIKQSPEVKQSWQHYHLIADVLRQPEYLSKDLSAAFFQRLREEPTVLAPQGKRPDKTGLFAMSAVASIMAMVFLAWISASIDTRPGSQMAKQGAMVASEASTLANENNMNDYLLAHHEFSPGVDVRGAASYIRTVAMKPEMAGK